MNMLTFFALASALGAVVALACGIAAMAGDGEVAHRRSEVWMGWRVACQGIALLFAALMLFGSAQAEPPASRDCIYDYTMITDQECRAYRAQVLAAGSEEERLALLQALLKIIDERALERGVSPDDWRGLAATPRLEAGGVSQRATGTGLPIAILVAGLVAIAAVVFLLARSFWPVRNMRLMRCPETGSIVFVGAERVARGEGTAPEARVWSCELWPGRKDCARGCLQRLGQTEPGHRIDIEALRPFDGR